MVTDTFQLDVEKANDMQQIEDMMLEIPSKVLMEIDFDNRFLLFTKSDNTPKTLDVTNDVIGGKAFSNPV